MSGLLVFTALGLEARALREGLPSMPGGAKVVRTGMGPRNAAAYAARALTASREPVAGRPGAVAVAGVGGALDRRLRPGDVVVASEVWWDGQALPCPSARLLQAELARAGVPVITGPLVTSGHLVSGAERGGLAARGALVVDMESGPVAAACAEAAPGGGLPFAAVRIVVDTPDVPLLRPATLRGGARALRTLRRAGRPLARWALAQLITPAGADGAAGAHQEEVRSI